MGLPLLEAQSLSVPIIASERDYVRDLVEPSQTFDPASPLSIARAVMRAMEKTEERVATSSANDFIKIVMDKTGVR